MMSGETDLQMATQADLQELAAQMATQADLKAQDLKIQGQILKLQEQMRARQTGRRGAAGADIKRSLNRHTVAATVVTGLLGIVMVRDDEIAAWLQEVVPRFFA